MRNTLLFASLLLSSLTLFADSLPVEETSLVVPPPSEETLIVAIDNLGPDALELFAVGDFGPDEEEDADQFVLRDFIESRGLIACRQKSGCLTFAGDARARWLSASETVNGISKRGFFHDNPDKGVAVNRFKSELNLFFDYVADRSWVSSKVKWSNFDGIDGGSPTRVDLDRAFIGYDIYYDDATDFYIEIGRSDLGFMFESRVEFASMFNGIHFYYTRYFPGFCNFIVHGGPFIVDSFTHHYPWVAEIFFQGLADSYFSVKYSIVDWRHRDTLDYGNKSASGKAAIRRHPRYQFIVSQLIFGYEREIDWCRCKTLYAYLAFLANSAAKKRFTTDDRYLNHAWYGGFTLGKLCKACDWSLDVNYQSVQAQAIPEFDLSGIGHGNAENILLSDQILAGVSPINARGFTNYKGWSGTLLYALTDSLSLRAIAQESRPRNKTIGGRFHYKSFEFAVIYAW